MGEKETYESFSLRVDLLLDLFRLLFLFGDLCTLHFDLKKRVEEEKANSNSKEYEYQECSFLLLHRLVVLPDIVWYSWLGDSDGNDLNSNVILVATLLEGLGERLVESGEEINVNLLEGVRGEAKKSDIENQMLLARERARADAQYYYILREAEANKLKYTENYLKYVLYSSLANNSKVYFSGEKMPAILSQFMSELGDTVRAPVSSHKEPSLQKLEDSSQEAKLNLP